MRSLRLAAAVGDRAAKDSGDALVFGVLPAATAVGKVAARRFADALPEAVAETVAKSPAAEWPAVKPLLPLLDPNRAGASADGTKKGGELMAPSRRQGSSSSSNLPAAIARELAQQLVVEYAASSKRGVEQGILPDLTDPAIGGKTRKMLYDAAQGVLARGRAGASAVTSLPAAPAPQAATRGATRDATRPKTTRPVGGAGASLAKDTVERLLGLGKDSGGKDSGGKGGGGRAKGGRADEKGSGSAGGGRRRGSARGRVVRTQRDAPVGASSDVEVPGTLEAAEAEVEELLARAAKMEATAENEAEIDAVLARAAEMEAAMAAMAAEAMAAEAATEASTEQATRAPSSDPRT